MSVLNVQVGDRAYPVRRIVAWRQGTDIDVGEFGRVVEVREVLECGHQGKVLLCLPEQPLLTTSRRCRACATAGQRERAQQDAVTTDGTD